MKPLYFVGIVTAGVLAGCHTPAWKERFDDARETSVRIQAETRAYLATNPAPMTLETALDLAGTRSLKLAQAQLDRQLAAVQQGISFAAFLPQVNVTFQRRGTDVPLEYSLLGKNVQMTDQYVSTAAATLTQPLFTPNAWLLFAESRQLYRVRELQLERAREMLDVQVAGLFYQTAVAGELVKTYEAQQKADKEMARQITALAKEGYALDPERERVLARLANDTYQLECARDTRTLAGAKMAEILRFWPGERTLTVDGASMTNVLARPWKFRDTEGNVSNTPPEAVQNVPLPELLWQTLLNRRELWIGDQVIRIRKTELLRVLTGFLPELYGSASGNYTSQKIEIPHQYWAGGFSAVMSVFKGFQTVNEYRRAREEKKTEFLLQEDRALTLMVSTLQAHQNWRQCFRQKAVADQALRAARMDYEATNARFKQEQETLSEVLDKLAALETARVQAVSAAYASALAEIVLRDAIGVGISGEEKNER